VEEVEAGIYTWIVATDLHFGDSLVAKLFGLDPLQTRRGLPLSRYVNRIHPQDRAGVSQLIAKAVDDGRPFYAEYRVIGADGSVQEVIDVGRCYYHNDGVPYLCSGIVYPVTRLQV